MTKDLTGLILAIVCWIFFFLLMMLLLCRRAKCGKCPDSEADQARIVNVYYIGSVDNEESHMDPVIVSEDLPPAYNDVVGSKHSNHMQSSKIPNRKRYSF